VIPPEAVPARVTMIITTLLVLSSIANNAFTNSPLSSSINLIQLYSLVMFKS
jgi:hypothetical protein